MRKRSEDSQKVFTRILIGIIISTVATLLVASSILYVNYNRIALRQVYRTDMNSLTQTSREVAKMTETAKSLSYQIYQDYTISSLLLYSKPDIYEITSAMEQLDNYRMSLPFIESIYVYNSKSNEFFISSDVRNGQQSISEIDDQGLKVSSRTSMTINLLFPSRVHIRSVLLKRQRLTATPISVMTRSMTIPN